MEAENEQKTASDPSVRVEGDVSGTDEPAYLKEVVTRTVLKYNPRYGDDRVCQCGHAYYRHFDSYENMEPIGCKYCDCVEFVEATNYSSTS